MSITYFLLFLVFWFSSSGGGWSEDDFGEAHEVQSKSRFFPFFLGPSVIRIAHTTCTGENGLVGTCYTANDCASNGGKTSGTCSKGFGRCCVIQKTCGMSSKANCTYFSSPNYPVPYAGGDTCKFTIWRCGSDVCQLRLDFLDFNLAPPDANGNCMDDFLVVSGGSSKVPRICGLNTGEHVYVDFSGGAPINFLIETSGAVTMNRQWNIKITQIKCCDRAPVGCLMYYKGTSGKVMSFNYASTASTATSPDLPGPGTRELANLNYGVCVEMAPGFCSIEWSQNPNDDFSFTVSNATDSLAPDLVGHPDASVTGSNCTGDYVIIPNPMQGGVTLPYDRFCGNYLPTVTSSSKPFVLTVVTNNTEMSQSSDSANRGFCLNYRQLPCI